ncbi:chromate transporter [Nitrosomonas communis]|uniref:chromate transporter n=1 Tax=Nitrosomonas communis TaxID=44574 RepID=UPI003D2B70EE
MSYPGSTSRLVIPPSLVAGLLYDIKPAVIAIVGQAAYRIGLRTLKNSGLWVMAAASFVAIAVFQIPFPAILLAAALIGYIGGHARSVYGRHKP